MDAAAVDSAMPVLDAGVDAQVDAGNTDPNLFMVPATGGSFDYMTPSGIEVSFAFPASAAGTAITLTPLVAADVDWGDDLLATSFSQVIELGPDGTSFADPIQVAFSNGALFAFNFSVPGGVPEPLQLAADGASLLLTHFSSLAVVAADQTCQSTSGWRDTADSVGCTGHGSESTLRGYTCKNYQFCQIIEASCCVAPGDADADCQVGDTALSLRYIRTGSNGGAYPYCDAGFVTPPHVATVAPGLIANSTAQTITLTGTSFDPDGSVFVNTDSAIATTWVSATQVTASVPAALLTAVGTLSDVGYVNPISTASGVCSAASPSNCDWLHRSNLTNVAITAVISTDPTVSSGLPASLLADSTAQVITLTGTNFEVGGSVFHGPAQPLPTTRISATEVTATVPASYFTAVGTLLVGYANALSGTCDAANPSNCDWTNASNVLSIPIVAPVSANPTLTSISPGNLIANSTDQVITLTGTGFGADGSAFYGQDAAITTVWVSATQATATVPGAQLGAPGVLTFVGYVNPPSTATGACSAATPGNCDWQNRSNMLDIPIQ